MTPLFHLENIVRTYPDPASRDPHAVRTVLNLSELDIRAGEILGIRGHNGSGKSTLLRIIALLEPPDSGTVLFEGRPAGTDDLHLRRQVTLLLQTPYLLSRSVASNVAYGLRVRGIRNASELQNRIAASLLAVGLDPAVFLHRRRHELSGGECQRVALAARLALRPRVLLMDEPTASVDQQSAERIALPRVMRRIPVPPSSSFRTTTNGSRRSPTASLRYGRGSWWSENRGRGEGDL